MLKKGEIVWCCYFGVLVWLGLTFLPAPLAAPASEEPVVVDIVARDKSGELVKDLAAEDLEVTDAGVKQTIADFKAAVPEKRLVTLVLGGLGNEGRQYARQAVGDLLTAVDEDALIAVFVIDRRLYALESYTNNKKDIKEAVEIATSGSFEKYIKRSQELHDDLMKKLGRVIVGGADANRIVIDVLNRSAEMLKEDWSYAALDSLNVLVEELGRAQGRKPVIFLSQGVVISDVMFNRFDFLVSAANQANAPVYTVDCRGLLLASATASSQAMLEGARSASESQFATTGATSSWQARSLENASQSVRMNVQETLASLSMRTGGSLLANTNDTREGMGAMAEEIGNYYQLTYVPDNRTGDGTYHEIEVKSDRDDVQLQTSRGYFDAPSVGSSMLLSYELPMLTALGQEALQNDFGLKTRFLHFGPNEGEIQHTFALEAPLKHFVFAANEEAGTYTTHFSLLGVLKDPDGEIVQKFSQDYPLQGPLDKMEGMQGGNVMFLRNCYAAPGSYTLEAAAYDHASKKLSAIRTPVEIAQWPDAPVISSLMVIDRVDPISDEAKEVDNPLRYQNMKIAPNLGTPLVKAPDGQVGLYCVVYPSPTNSAKPVVGLVFFKDGQPLFQGQPPLPPPDEKGRIQVVLNLPIANFQPGNYDVTAVVQQGEAVAEQKVSFSIVE